MKHVFALVAACVVGFACAPIAHTQVVTTNWTTGYFNTGDGYGPLGSSLDGAPTNAPSGQEWQTTDPYNGTNYGSTSLMTFVPGWTLGGTNDNNQSVYWGNYDPTTEFAPGEFGILPGVTNPVLYRQFTVDPGTYGGTTIWSADFGIVYNPPGYAYQDVFGFDLLDSTGTNSLAKFSFNPATATLGDLRFEWFSNGALQTNNIAQPSAFEIQYGALYRITATLNGPTFDLSIAGVVTQTNGLGDITGYSVVTNQTVITGGALSGAFSSIDFATAALNWELASGNNVEPGPNYMVLNTMSVENSIAPPIPEPGTWATGVALFGLAGFILWRRKATIVSANL